MGKTILLVDDSETMLMFEKTILEELGVAFMTAKDGDKAIQTVSQSRPDLIILDIMMPNKNGIDTCKELKQNPATKDIPIIMVTGDPKKIEESLSAGCDDFVAKPIDKMELIQKVKALL